MFLPFDRKLDWTNPPYVTIFLILLNCFIFSIFQSNDSKQFTLAYDYYFDSELPEIELPYYILYLKHQTNYQLVTAIQNNIDHKNEPALMKQVVDMLHDGAYKKALQQNKIIRPENDDFRKWQILRTNFETKLNSIISYKYSLIASDPQLITLITHIFLHADSVHLIGNMVFLFIFGFVLEIVFGRPLYLAAYLLSGIGSGIFYIMLDSNSAAAGIGASGAISGLVGMYTVAFGLRKIRFFYFLVFYFNYIKAPAIILLPLWFIYDLSQQFWGPENVNNIAHIGGLLCGALIAYLLKRFSNMINMSYLDQHDIKADFQHRYRQALDFISILNFDKAQPLLKKLLVESPDDLNVKFQLYNISKHQPNSIEFHQLAIDLMSLAGNDHATVKMIHDVYADYIKITSQAKLNPELLVNLTVKFAGSHYIIDAEKILLFIINKKPNFPTIPKALLSLVKHYRLNSNEEKFLYYSKLLKTRYANSSEAQALDF